MGMPRACWLSSALIVLALCACDSLSEPAEDSGPAQAGAGASAATGQAGTGPVRPPPLPEEVLLDPRQAACLGLDTPVCAGCHGIHGDGLIVLRPAGAPPHPPATLNTSQDDLRSCGL